MNSQNNKTKNNNLKVLRVLKIVFLSLIVVLLGIFYMSKKENLDLDEAYTYGLANNSFQLDIEEFEEYTGEEILLKYAAVKDNEGFNVKNVFFNQSNDTHPPFYYLLVNFVSSLFKNQFSMWYGLIVNLIFLVILFWEMRHLFSLVIKDNLFSTILTIISFTSYGFINEIVFTRMYLMLSAISMGLVILILNYMKNSTESVFNLSLSNNQKVSDLTSDLQRVSHNKKMNLRFLVLFFLICVCGILTQYHFMIIAAFFSLVFAIDLIKNKNIKLLIETFVVGALAIFISYLIFPSMLNHILGQGGLHSLSSGNVIKSRLEIFFTLSTGLFTSFFSYGVILYVILLIIGIILYLSNVFKTKKSIYSINNKTYSINAKLSDDNSEIADSISINFYIIFVLSFIFYFAVIICTVTYDFHRYLYNIYPILSIIIYAPIYLLYKNLNKYFRFVVIVLAIIMTFSTKIDKAPTNLNVEDELFINYLKENADTKMILLYRSVDENGISNSQNSTLWKMPAPIYLFKDMKNLTYVDIGKSETLSQIGSKNKIRDFTNKTVEGYDDIFLVIFAKENDEALIRDIMMKNNVSTYSKIYFTNYFHIYRLT